MAAMAGTRRSWRRLDFLLRSKCKVSTAGLCFVNARDLIPIARKFNTEFEATLVQTLRQYHETVVALPHSMYFQAPSTCQRSIQSGPEHRSSSSWQKSCCFRKRVARSSPFVLAVIQELS